MDKCFAFAVLMLALLNACASRPALQSIPRNNFIELVVVKSPQASGAIAIHNDTLGRNTKTGVRSGTVTGGLWGLTCGPWAIVCVPVGAAIGAIVGTGAGAVVGATGVLPEDKGTLLRERVTSVMQSHSLLDELNKHVHDRARAYWNVDAGQAASVVRIELQDLLLASTRDERIRFVVQVRVSVQPQGAKPIATPKQILYEYASPHSGLDIWLDKGSDFFDTSLTSASQQLATQIIADLASK
jgi:hypothetical protein